jgi:DNA-directed RNA polymerase specialized sigma subunit
MSSDFGNIFLSRDHLSELAHPPAKNRLEPEYAEAYNQWKKSPTEANRDQVLSHISPIIHYAVSQIPGDRNYLTIRGKILAAQALEKYDPAVASLGTYLSQALLPLRRYARAQMNVLTVPERVLLLSQQLEGAETELEADLGRAPTTAELADHMKMSAAAIEKARRALHARNSGSFEVPSEEGNISSPAVSRKIPEKYQHDYVLSRFSSDPVSSFIYENDCQMHGRKKLSTEELAKKLKITPGAVSQRRQKIYATLNSMQKLLYAGH